MPVAPVEPRLLRVVPDGTGGWSIRERRTGEVLGAAPTADAALEQATGLLEGGGAVQVVDAGDFIIARAYVPPPPVPWRTAVRRASLTLAVALALGLLVWWLLDAHAFAVLVGVVLGGQVMTLGRLVVASRRRRKNAPPAAPVTRRAVPDR